MSLAGIVSALQLTPVPAFAEEPQLIPPVELREDLALVRRALEESQVGLDWYLSRQEYGRQMEAVDQKLDKPMAARDFYRLILPVIAALGHGHTLIERPAFGSGFYLRRLAPSQTYLPAETRIIDNRLFVLSDLSDSLSLPAGSEIVALNGEPFESLYPRLLSLLSTEGDNRTFRNHQLGRGWRMLDLLDLEQGPRSRFDIILRLTDGSTRHITIDGATPAQLADRFTDRRGRPIDTFRPAVSLSMKDANTGILTISSFWEGLLPKEQPSFEAAFVAAFEALAAQGATRLIIDVRGNEGGNGAIASLLRSYLTTKPFVRGGRGFVAQPSLSTFGYAIAPSDEVRAFAADPATFVELAPDGIWRLKPEFEGEATATVESKANAFTGSVAILIDGGAFSTANTFIDLMRCEKAAGRDVRFFGVANAQSDRSPLVSGGQSLEIELPHSKLKLAIPILGSDRPGSPDCRKTPVPDVEVVPSINDLIIGHDPVMEAAVQNLDL